MHGVVQLRLLRDDDSCVPDCLDVEGCKPLKSGGDAASASGGGGKRIVLEEFQFPRNDWRTLNDPVMGGQSHSTLTIDDAAGVARFKGRCAIVPSLQAPGFIAMETGGQLGDSAARFPDVSSCAAFEFELRSNVPYAGYRFAFGKVRPRGNRFAYGYKARLTPPAGEFGAVLVPFDQFSDKWNDATGEIEASCLDDARHCPSPRWLRTMETMSFWAEGVEGDVDLEVKTIAAVGCDPTASDGPRTPSAVGAKVRTIRSNPFYLGAAVAVMVLACGVCTCLLCCCCRGRRGEKGAARLEAALPPAPAYRDGVVEDYDLEIT